MVREQRQDPAAQQQPDEVNDQKRIIRRVIDGIKRIQVEYGNPDDVDTEVDYEQGTQEQRDDYADIPYGGSDDLPKAS